MNFDMNYCIICKSPILFGNKNTKYCLNHKGKNVRRNFLRQTRLDCLRKINQITSEDNPVEIGRMLRAYYYEITGCYPE